MRALLLRKGKKKEVDIGGREGKRKGFAGPMSNCFLRPCLGRSDNSFSPVQALPCAEVLEDFSAAAATCDGDDVFCTECVDAASSDATSGAAAPLVLSAAEAALIRLNTLSDASRRNRAASSLLVVESGASAVIPLSIVRSLAVSDTAAANLPQQPTEYSEVRSTRDSGATDTSPYFSTLGLGPPGLGLRVPLHPLTPVRSRPPQIQLGSLGERCKVP